MKFTLSVRSFHVPATPCTSAWPPSFPSVPTSRATRVTSDAKELSWSTIVLMVSFSSRISPRTSTVIFLDKSPFATAVVTGGDVSHLIGQVRRHGVHRVGQVLPRTGDAFHVRPVRRAFLPYPLRGPRGSLPMRTTELVHHGVDGVFEFENFAAHVDGDLLGQVAVRHGGRHLGDVSHLAGEVGRPWSSPSRSDPSTYRRRLSLRPGRRAFLPYPLRAPRGSLRRRRRRAGPPWC